MKEMQYGINRIVEVLNEGERDGYKYAILSLGTHPTAYVKVPKSHPCFNQNYADMDIEVHGGLTYRGEAYWIDNDDSYWIGWDYAHAGDYTSFCYNFSDSKKWTTSEIYNDVLSVIKQLESKQKGSEKNEEGFDHKRTKPFKKHS